MVLISMRGWDGHTRVPVELKYNQWKGHRIAIGSTYMSFRIFWLCKCGY